MSAMPVNTSRPIMTPQPSTSAVSTMKTAVWLYDMLIEDGQEKIYRFPDRFSIPRLSWFVIFSSVCSCRQMTLVILDRETEGLVRLSLRRVRRLCWSSGPCGSILVKMPSGDDYILWNNFYDYQFTNADKVDFFIVATEAQKRTLEQQFHYSNKTAQNCHHTGGSLNS